MNAIVLAAREQSTGLQEINTAVNTMDQGTQQNAAMVEEQTAASHGLANEAAELNALLAQFKMGGTCRKVGTFETSLFLTFDHKDNRDDDIPTGSFT